MVEVTVQLDEREFELLTRLGQWLGTQQRRSPEDPPSTPAADVLERLLDHIDSGITRPGSWERPWLCQVFGYDWQAGLEPDPEEPSWRQRFTLDGPESCKVCGDELEDEERMQRDSSGAFVGLCVACEDERGFAADAAAAAALRDGRALPCYSELPNKDWTTVEDDRGPALSAAELERRAVAGHEQHRPHGPSGGEGCLGCSHTQDFLCVGCERWRCFCRGGGDEPLVTRSFCDSCWDRYHDHLDPHRSAFVRLLQGCFVAAIPVDFLARADRALWSMIQVSGLASLTERRRAFSLGRRALRGATPAQRAGLVLLTWPGMWEPFRKRIEYCTLMLRRANAIWAGPMHTKAAVWAELQDFRFQLGEALSDMAVLAKQRPRSPAARHGATGALRWLWHVIPARDELPWCPGPMARTAWKAARCDEGRVQSLDSKESEADHG